MYARSLFCILCTLSLIGGVLFSGCPQQKSGGPKLRSENPPVSRGTDPDHSEEPWKNMRISIKEHLFTTEPVVFKERRYTIGNEADAAQVSRKLAEFFDESYLSAILPPTATPVLYKDALPIAALGPFYALIWADLKRKTPLLEGKEIDKIEYVLSGNALMRTTLYSALSSKTDKREEETFYFFRAKPQEGNPSPIIGMSVPQKQLYQVYLNLAGEKKEASPPPGQLLLSCTPIDPDVTLDGETYALERLQFAPATFTHTTQKALLSLVEGWRVVHADKTDAKKNTTADFHQFLEMTFFSAEGGLHSGLMKQLVVATADNRISPRMVDLSGKETQMSFYCYKAISKTQGQKSLFLAFPYDFEKGR